MAKHRLTIDDIEDIKDIDSNDPYLEHLLSRFGVAGEFDEDYG